VVDFTCPPPPPFSPSCFYFHVFLFRTEIKEGLNYLILKMELRENDEIVAEMWAIDVDL
jgi:hypothetical protein